MGVSERRATKGHPDMKMRTIIERNQDRGFFPALAVDAGSHDYTVLAGVGVLRLSELVSVARDALAQGEASEKKVASGNVDVSVLGFSVPVIRKVVETVALYDPEDERVRDLVGLVYLTPTSNYRQARLSVCVKGDFGAYEQVPPTEMPLPVVRPDEFVSACTEAISAGHVSVSERIMSDGKFVRRNVSQRSHLCEYQLDVSVHGVTKPIRLDIAMALVKRAEGMPVDAYGSTVIGATYPMTGKGSKRWQVTYVVPKGRFVEMPDRANIDHVIPQSLGGRTRLCNLQAMRSADNARKSSEILADVSGEPMRSAKVVLMLAKGMSAARREGYVSDEVRRSVLSICRRELAACVDFIMGDDRVRPDSVKSRRERAVAALKSGIAGSFGTASVFFARICS